MLYSVFSKLVLTKNLCSVLLFCVLSFNTDAQLDSANIDTVYLSPETVIDSLGFGDTLNILDIDVYVNDTDFLGEIVVGIYDQGSDFPMSMVKQSKAELQANQQIAGLVVSMRLLTAARPPQGYRIEVQVRNHQGGNLPLLIATL